jgi:membrane protease YdiL (CAAX protease family)
VFAARSFVDRVFVEPLRSADSEARANIARDGRVGVDRRVVVVLVTTAVVCVLIEYVAMSNRYGATVAMLDLVGLHDAACWLDRSMDAWEVERHCAIVLENPELRSSVNVAGDVRFERQAYWGVWALLAYLVVPLTIARLAGIRASELGLRVRGAFAEWRVYLAMVAVMMPVVWLISRNESFLETYPFYEVQVGEPLWPRFATAELFYFGQFFALEFFFRGFVLHGLRPRLGAAAVLVMIVPYCMIHFGKPLPETLGAIVAGLLLGALSLKSRSIVPGAMVHVAVALAMDFAALARKGLLWN